MRKQNDIKDSDSKSRSSTMTFGQLFALVPRKPLPRVLNFLSLLEIIVLQRVSKGIASPRIKIDSQDSKRQEELKALITGRVSPWITPFIDLRNQHIHLKHFRQLDYKMEEKDELDLDKLSIPDFLKNANSFNFRTNFSREELWLIVCYSISGAGFLVMVMSDLHPLFKLTVALFFLAGAALRLQPAIADFSQKFQTVRQLNQIKQRIQIPPSYLSVFSEEKTSIIFPALSSKDAQESLTLKKGL